MTSTVGTNGDLTLAAKCVSMAMCICITMPAVGEKAET